MGYIASVSENPEVSIFLMNRLLQGYGPSLNDVSTFECECWAAGMEQEGGPGTVGGRGGVECLRNSG